MKQIPPSLQPGDTIGITCPSGYIAYDKIATAAQAFKQKGFSVIIGATAGTMYHYFSGDDNSRLNDLQAMLDSPHIAAIVMGRGGYGMSRIIDRLDFTGFLRHPKWICGFSDITLLHHHIQAQYGIPTLHSPMCGAFRPDTEGAAHLDSFYNALAGQTQTYQIPVSPYHRTGVAEGLLIGGNLAMLAHLTGSSSDTDTVGKILFLEDVGEYLYNADRMLMQLKRAGKLDRLAGLILGGFTDMQDTERPFGQTIEAILRDKVEAYSYPVCFDFPAGHQEDNHTLALGMPHRLTITADTGGILQRLHSTMPEV